MIVPPRPRYDLSPMAPHDSDGNFAVVFREETAHRHLSPSQHTLTNHHAWRRGIDNVRYIIVTVVIVEISPSMFVLSVSCAFFVFFKVSGNQLINDVNNFTYWLDRAITVNVYSVHCEICMYMCNCTYIYMHTVLVS